MIITGFLFTIGVVLALYGLMLFATLLVWASGELPPYKPPKWEPVENLKPGKPLA